MRAPVPGGERSGLSPLAGVLLGALLLGVGLASWRPVPAGVWHDDGVYAMVGRALASGEGLVYGGVPGAPPAVKFPPLYSAFLALLWWVGGGVGMVSLLGTVANLAALAAAGVLLAHLLARDGGLPPRVAMAAAAVAFVSADLIRTALTLLSEPLFLVLSLSALLMVPRAAKGERRGTMALAALLCAAVLTRSAAVAVAGGVVFGLLLQRAWRGAVVAAVAPGLVFAAWSAWSAQAAMKVPAALRDILGPYGGWLRDQFAGGGGGVLAGLPRHAAAIADRVTALLVPGTSGWTARVAGAVVLLAAGYGFARLGRRAASLAGVAFLYVLMLLVWPYVDRRLVAPLHPILAAGAVAGFWHLSRGHRRRRLRMLAAGVGLVWAGAFAVVSAGRAASGWAAAAYRLRAERLAAAVEVLDRSAPPDAVVGAAEFWAALHLHGGWPAVPAAPFRPAARGTPVWGTAAEQAALWSQEDVRFLLLEQGGRVHGDALDLVEGACPGSVVVVARMPPQMVVRLDWNGACRARFAGGPAAPVS